MRRILDELNTELISRYFSDYADRNTFADLQSSLFTPPDYSLEAPSIDPVYANITGTAGDDILIGTDSDDVINGLAGDDEIYGGFGDDTINGGEGDDFIVLQAYFFDINIVDGGNGFDTVSYAHSAQNINIDLNDPLYSQDILSSIEVVEGTQYTDALWGDSDANTFWGLSGNDSIRGLDGNDHLYGGNGSDYIRGGSGDDVIYGGNGDDKLEGGLGSDHINGGAGIDRVDFYDGILIDDYSITRLGDTLWEVVSPEGTDTLEDVEILRGYEFSGLDLRIVTSVIFGDSIDNTLIGTEENDYIVGGDGRDTIYGGLGHDIIYGDGTSYVNSDEIHGGAGNDSLYGDRGADTIFGDEGDDHIEGGNWFDTLFGGVGNDILIGGADDDSLDGGEGIDVAVYEGNIGAYTITQNVDGSYTVEDSSSDQDGRDGIDIVFNVEIFRFANGDFFLGQLLFGTEGDDNLVGYLGDDTLIGGLGADVLDGNDGSDTASYETASALVRADLAGKVTHRGEAVGDSYISIENLTGSDYNDVLYGDNGDNILSSGVGNDRLYGRAGDDVLIGDRGFNKLYGNNGVDVMTGGDDIVLDRFIYFQETDSGVGRLNRDIITDFTSGEDRIEISRFDADSTGGTGNDVFTFIATSGFSNTAGELRYFKNNNQQITIIQADMDGDGVADFEIELTGVMDLVATDFLL